MNLLLPRSGDRTPLLLLAVALITAQPVAAAGAEVTFTRISSGPIAASSGGTGGAWGDFNHTGSVDLFISSYPGPSSVLYTNNGKGVLAVASAAGLDASTGSSWGCAWGDFDNDGNLDVIGSVYGSGANYLLRNTGHGTFAKIAGAPIGPGSGNNIIWGDYDNDGFIDAFCAGSNGGLFRNNGQGGFTAQPSAFAKGDSGTQGATWGDYDNDGFLDLFTTRVNQPNLLYHNNGNGTFTKITNAAFAANSSISQGCSWGDYDNDGYLDLVVCNVGANNYLYHNNRDGTFSKVVNSAITTVTANSSGSAWADYDNDGYLDLFIAARGGACLLFHNNGDGTFTRVTTGHPVLVSGTWTGAAWGDVNNDGFPDLFVANQGGANALYLNGGNSNNWLTVQCLGRVSNRAAIGAKVRVQAVISGQARWQMREISGGGGLASQNDLRAQFGLGDATNAQVVRVEWPSGITQEFTNVVARQFLTVKEPSRLKAEMPSAGSSPRLTLTGGQGLAYQLEISNDLSTWTPVATGTNQTGALLWTNLPPAQSSSVTFRAKEL